MVTRSFQEKIKTVQELQLILEEYRSLGKRVVLTNGCFDLLHPGHIRYLEHARGLGDALVVGLNSDESVKRLKGSSRPVLRERDRLEVIAGLESVDWVTIFHEDTPAQLIRLLRPQVLAKGGDWPLDQIVGREDVEASGGLAVSIPIEVRHSTSSIIRRIRGV